MPELAEVEYYRKQWSPGKGEAVAGVNLHAEKRIFHRTDTEALAKGLPGQVLERSATHGKQMCFVFGGSHWLGVHLGMTGRTFTIEAGYHPSRHDHLVITMKSGRHLVFSDPRLFGRILYAESKTPPEWWSDLPPEVLSEEFTEEYLQNFLRRRARAPLKSVLLMQQAFPGVGNWMADEILWRARVHPATPAGKLTPQKRRELYRRLREVAGDAMEVIGKDWSTPPDDWLFNHRWKDGGVCPQTGRPLRREKIGGRMTCWSPAWQKAGSGAVASIEK